MMSQLSVQAFLDYRVHDGGYCGIQLVGGMQRLTVSLVCGSTSMSSMHLPARSSPMPRLTVLTVLPTPPFLLARAMTYCAWAVPPSFRFTALYSKEPCKCTHFVLDVPYAGKSSGGDLQSRLMGGTPTAVLIESPNAVTRSRQKYH